MHNLALLGTAALLLLLAQLQLSNAQAAAAAAPVNAAAKSGDCPITFGDLTYWDWTPLSSACGEICLKARHQQACALT